MKKAKLFKTIAIIAFVILIILTILYFISSSIDIYFIDDMNFARIYKTLIIIIILFSSFSASAKLRSKEKKD